MMNRQRLTLADKINTIVNHVKTSAEQTGEILPVEARLLLGTINVNLVGYRVETPQKQMKYLTLIDSEIEKYELKHGITNNLADSFATLGAGLIAIRKEIKESLYLFPEPELTHFEKTLNDQLDNAEMVPIDELEEQILTMYRGNAGKAFYHIFDFLKSIHGDLESRSSKEESGGITRE